MRKLSIGLAVGALLFAGNAMAAGNDLFELSLGGLYHFDSDYLGATGDKSFDPGAVTFPTIGEYSVGFGFGAAIGHRFATKRSHYDMFIRYGFSLAPEADGDYITNTAGDVVDTNTAVAGQTTNSVTGTLYQQDVSLVLRLTSELFPYDFLRNPNLFVDFSAGVTSFTFDYEVEKTPFGNAGGATTTTHNTTRSGLSFGFGLGYNFDLDDDLNLQVRGDLNFGQIQDVEDVNGNLVRQSPSSSNLMLNLVLSKQFNSLF